MLPHDLHPHTIEIPNNLISSFKASTQKYEIYKEEQAERQKSEVVNNQRPIIESEIKDLTFCRSDERS